MKTTPDTEKVDRSAESMQALADKFAAMIESGQANPNAWRKSWKSFSGNRPHNVQTKTVYSGGNALMLSITSIIEGWGNDWSTFQGWKTLGASVRKGEKAKAYVLIPKPVITREEKAAAASEGRAPQVSFMRWDAMAVFNAAQVDGWTAPEVTPTAAPDISAISAFVTATRADVRHGGDRAFYSPLTDSITLPTPEQFTDAARYAGTALHELGHWTGHESRLNRLGKNRFGDEGYAFEELVAELTSAHLCVELGFEAEPSLDSAQYLAGWLRAIKGDPKALWTAAGLASKAATFLTTVASGALTEQNVAVSA